ncbi:MAG: sigma 54-interacting transcriptional regulator [Ignavibacteria bacterium]|nr:sigma 54-interacting transcriptional regulator [Ignavibacteria bacterium]
MTDLSSLQQRIDELEGLNRLAQTLCSTLEIDEILSAIIDASLTLCHAHQASIVLMDPSTKETVKTLVHEAGTSRERIEHTVNMLVAGWILEHQKPFRADNLIDGLGLKNPPDRYRRHGSVLAVPLQISGEVIGIINLINEAEGYAFGEDSMRVATIIAQQSGQFIHHAKLHEKLFEENERLKRTLEQHYKVNGVVGTSKKMKDILDTLPVIAKSSATVLVYGETGTGKELVARAIHFQSDRNDKPFIPLNCAAIPANLIESELFGHERGAFTGASGTMIGKFELADKGTIFLEEIAEMPLELQPKLLRLLEERRFFRLGSSVERSIDVRVIAATNRDLLKLTRDGKFREDLYYRLNVMPISLPPLRERKDDIPILAQYFLDEFSHNKKKLSHPALERLQSFEWKGNVRELKNIIERLALLIPSEEITAAHLQALNIASIDSAASTSDLSSMLKSLIQSNNGKNDLLDEIEKNVVHIALRESNGNVSEAARLLGVDRKALDRRKEKYCL